MHPLERFIYDLVKHNPRLKKRIRNLYQRIFDILPQPAPQSAYPITNRPGYFYGFHDHTPFSADNTKLLANRYETDLRMPTPDTFLDVGYFDGPDYKIFHPIARTRAWMWHMGCKLQWRGTRNEIVFNDHDSGKNIARMVDIDTGYETRLPDSIGSVSPDGQLAVGYSFARVAKCMPGYGYHFDVGDPEIDNFAPRKNGVHLINLETQHCEQLFSLADLAELRPEPSMQDALHFATHTVFSPDSQRFIFLHRWIHNDVSKRWSRMISSDLSGKDLHVFPTIDMVSHIGWKNSHHVLAYCRVAEHGDQYVLFEDKTNNFTIIGKNQFNSDGHPSYDPSGRWIVTDTYPDRRRVQNLVVYDTLQNTRHELARLPMPPEFQTPDPYHHWACDLHPRWDRRGRFICFDAAYTGTRALCSIDLGEEGLTNLKSL